MISVIIGDKHCDSCCILISVLRVGEPVWRGWIVLGRQSVGRDVAHHVLIQRGKERGPRPTLSQSIEKSVVTVTIFDCTFPRIKDQDCCSQKIGEENQNILRYAHKKCSGWMWGQDRSGKACQDWSRIVSLNSRKSAPSDPPYP